MPHLLEGIPRFVFFTGKGGVGKTSIACATAVTLADAGQRVLLVSTDPASNVGQALETTVGHSITPIPGVPGLDALELDPMAAAEAYREKIIGPVRAILPAKEIATITEQLSGSCTTEVASFNEFTHLLADPEATRDYDHVVFDTAPTGHTIRLLQLPGDWTSYLDDGRGDTSCLGPLAGLEKSRQTYREALHALTDPSRTRVVLVTRAQASTLAEAARAQAELSGVGIDATHLVVNGCMPSEPVSDPVADGIRAREAAALATMPPTLAALPRDEITLRRCAMVGLPALRYLLGPEDQPASAATAPAEIVWEAPGGLGALLDDLPSTGLVMTVGKGGVGKTTMAAAIARDMARRGADVLLTTTDPAAHLHLALTDDVEGLEVQAIDPRAATQAYRDRIMQTKGAALDDNGRAALAEDLRSPCTEEIAIFEQFSQAVEASDRRLVVMDTAPTGHTLLLMDATGAYHREITRHQSDDEAAQASTPLQRLQDPEKTRVVVVTLPESTPVWEAEDLVADLARSQITPWAWIINGSLAAARPSSPLLRARAVAEIPLIARVAAQAPRVAVVAAQADEPTGASKLSALL